ncbi:MAG: hypothetical protein RR979_06215, partial [Mucinivorans sp.]
LARKQLDFEMVGTIDFATREMTVLPEPDLSGAPLADNVRFTRSSTSKPRSGGKAGGGSRSGKPRRR